MPPRLFVIANGPGRACASASVWIDKTPLSVQTDGMDSNDLAHRVGTHDPSIGLRAAGALHRLAEQVEAAAVTHARQQGWSWEQIGDALAMSRQSVHAKYGKGLRHG